MLLKSLFQHRGKTASSGLRTSSFFFVASRTLNYSASRISLVYSEHGCSFHEAHDIWEQKFAVYQQLDVLLCSGMRPGVPRFCSCTFRRNIFSKFKAFFRCTGSAVSHKHKIILCEKRDSTLAASQAMRPRMIWKWRSALSQKTRFKPLFWNVQKVPEGLIWPNRQSISGTHSLSVETRFEQMGCVSQRKLQRPRNLRYKIKMTTKNFLSSISAETRPSEDMTSLQVFLELLMTSKILIDHEQAGIEVRADIWKHSVKNNTWKAWKYYGDMD